MNQFRIILAAGAAAALGLAIPAAAHPDHETTKQVRELKIIKADGDKKIVVDGDMKELSADCGEGRKFESTSSSGDEKNKNVSKMVICSDPGESDAEWGKTLNKALADVEGNREMPAPAKQQIIADLKTEIAKLGK
jgi:hypothetical protein